MDIDGIQPARSRAKQTPVKKQTVPLRQSVAVNGTPVRRAKPVATAASNVTIPATHDGTKTFLLPRYHAPERPQKIIRKRMSKKGMALRLAAACTALVLATGGFLSWNAYVKFHKVFRGTSTVAALAPKTVTPSQLKGEGDGRVNILLLGIGGPGHDGPDLTDTIVVLSVDPVNNTADILSVPRDLWVKMPVNYFGSEQKINAAYESGKYHYLGKMDGSSANASAVEAGFTSIDQALKNVLDININYHMLVNFTAFQQAIDTVGGVTVNVPTQLYDPTFAWMNHGSPVIADAGVQTMNGFKALEYARSRETTSDFARGERQRQILIALKDKVLTAGTLGNPAKIDALMNAFGDNVYADLSTQGATRLFSIMKQVSDTKIASLGLTDEPHKLVTTDHIGATSVVRPLAGFNNYTDIQNYVRSQLLDGYIVKEHAPLTVLGATSNGAATSAALLRTYGYNVTSATATGQTSLNPVLVDLSGGKAPFTKHYLEARYGVTARTQLPAGVSVTPGSAKFVIIEPK